MFIIAILPDIKQELLCESCRLVTQVVTQHANTGPITPVGPWVLPPFV